MEGVAPGLPKALVPVLGEPFAFHQLRLLASQGVRDVVLVVGHLGEQIRDAVGDGSDFGLDVSYVDEGDELHGTGGALRVALDRGALADVFGVLYGDSYLPTELAPIWEAFAAAGRPALMTVHRNEDRWDRSNAVLEAGLVVAYDKRPEARDRAHEVDRLRVLGAPARGRRRHSRRRDRRPRRGVRQAERAWRPRRVRGEGALLRSRLAAKASPISSAISRDADGVLAYAGRP